LSLGIEHVVDDDRQCLPGPWWRKLKPTRPSKCDSRRTNPVSSTRPKTASVKASIDQPACNRPSFCRTQSIHIREVWRKVGGKLREKIIVGGAGKRVRLEGETTGRAARNRFEAGTVAGHGACYRKAVCRGLLTGFPRCSADLKWADLCEQFHLRRLRPGGRVGRLQSVSGARKTPAFALGSGLSG